MSASLLGCSRPPISTIPKLLKTTIGLGLGVRETWVRADSQAPRNGDIAFWGPWTDRSTTGRTHYGVALLVRQQISRNGVLVTEGFRGHSIWWKYQGIHFGGMYLAPSRPIEQIQATLTPRLTEENEPIVLIGDFNMSIGHLSGDHNWLGLGLGIYKGRG